MHLNVLHKHKRNVKADSEAVLSKPTGTAPASEADAAPVAVVASHPVYCPVQPPMSEEHHRLVEELRAGVVRKRVFLTTNLCAHLARAHVTGRCDDSALR